MNHLERFKAKILPKLFFLDESDCWLWLGRTNEKGYGKFDINRLPVYVHRFVWELINGPIKEGLCVCHTCDNPSCCNPSHLFLGTQEDNIHDMMHKGRHVGHKKLTEDQVREIKTKLGEGQSCKALAKEYKVSQSTISMINRGANWSKVA